MTTTDLAVRPRPPAPAPAITARLAPAPAVRAEPAAAPRVWDLPARLFTVAAATAALTAAAAFGPHPDLAAIPGTLGGSALVAATYATIRAATRGGDRS